MRIAQAAPAAAVALLLLLATWLDGAFDLRYWAPIAVLGLVALAVAQATDGIRIEPGPRLVVLVAIWAFAAWVALSALWADSAALAWEGAARTVLYATVVTLGLALPSRDHAIAVGAVIVGGVAAIVVVTLFALFIDGAGQFLAGRLDDPIGYRNGTAVLFALAFWPLLGLAAPRGYNPVLRGGALALAVLALGLVFLTQSRGVAIGLGAGAVASLLIGPDRVRRAWLGIIAVAAVAAFSGQLLEPYHSFQNGVATSDSDVHQAAVDLALLAVIAFSVGVLAALYDNGLRVSQRDTASRAATIGLGGVVIVVVIGALVAIGNPATYASDKWDEFTDLDASTSTGSTRLGSVGGQRYDLWRVAWKEFESDPVTGVGEGNYQFDYYKERRTDRNLNDPHGLQFRLLAETGLIGFLLFVGGFLVALGVAIARAARSADAGQRRWIAGLAAAGAVVLGQSLTDWLWLIPTLTGLGLLALALASAPDQEARDAVGEGEDGHGAGRRALARYGPAAAWAAVAVSVALLFLSDLFVRKARSEIGRDPQEQLNAARSAADLNPVSITPLYLQASALESMGDRAGARDALDQALDQEPQNFVTLALLGDLEVRADRPAQAHRYYLRASELDPLDIGLVKLARATGG